MDFSNINGMFDCTEYGQSELMLPHGSTNWKASMAALGFNIQIGDSFINAWGDDSLNQVDTTHRLIDNMCEPLHVFIHGAELAASQQIDLTDDESWGMMYFLRNRIREYNDMVDILWDRYSMTDRQHITLDSLPHINRMWGNSIEPQVGSEDESFFGGSLCNEKKYGKNKYVRKQWRKKKAAEEERQRVMDGVAEFQKKIKAKETHKERLIETAQNQVKHNNAFIVVHRELRNVILFRKEIAALKKQEEKARSDLNAKKYGKAKADSPEKAEANKKKELIQTRIRAQRALQYLDFVEKFKHEELEDKFDKLDILGDKVKKQLEKEVVTEDDIGYGFSKDEEKSNLENFLDDEAQKIPLIDLSDQIDFQAGDEDLPMYYEDIADIYIGKDLSDLGFVAKYILGCRRMGLRLMTKSRPELVEEAKYQGVTHMIEKIALLVTSIMMSDSAKQSIAIYTLFVSCHIEGGLSKTILDMLQAFFSAFADIEPQGGIIDSIKDRWTQVKESKSAGKMLALISFAVVAVFSKLFGYDSSKFDFEKYMSLGRPEPKGSVMEHIVDDALFFIDKGLVFFKTGSFQSLFIDEVIAKKYDEEFAFLLGNYQNVETDTMEPSCGISISTYLARLEQCAEDTAKMASHIGRHSERRFLTERQAKLIKMVDTTRKIVEGKNSRIKPYGIMLEGRSGVGKTTLKGMLIKLIMLANPMHFSGDKKSICTMNGDDPFQTELTNGHQVIVLDDMAQTTPTFIKVNHGQTVINILNNEPKAALKADVDSKGKVWYNCNLVVVTTNKEDLNAAVLSIEPAAILRRFEVCIKVKVKAGYIIDGGVGVDPEKTTSLFSDIWEFDCITHIPQADGRSTPRYIEFEGETLKNCSFQTLSDFLVANTNRHFEKQADLLSQQNDVHSMTLCVHRRLSAMCTDCPTNLETVEPEAGIIDTVVKAKNIMDYGSIIAAMIFDKWVKCTIVFFIFWITCFMSEYDYAIILIPIYGIIMGYVLREAKIIWKTMTKKKETDLSYWLSFKMSDYVRDHKYDFARGAFIVSVPFVVLALNYVRKLGKISEVIPQGATLTTPGLVEKPVESCWKVPIPGKRPVDVRLTTMTVPQGIDLVKSKLAYAEFEGYGYSDMFPLMSNIWIANWHMLVKKPSKVVVYVQGEDLVGPNFTSSISEHNIQRIGETDLGLVYLPKGGSQKNVMHLFPQFNTTDSTKARLIHKKKNGEVTDEVVFAEPKMISVNKPELQTKGLCYVYKRAEDTFNGLCMSALVSEDKYPLIIGFHYGGDTVDRKVGYTQQITQWELQVALEAIYADLDGPVVRTASAATPKLDFPDSGVYQCGFVHSKSPVRYLDTGSLRVYGDHTGHKTHYKSKQKETIIAKTVEAVCDAPIKYGPPQAIGSYKPKYAELVKITDTKEFPWDALTYAIKDFHTHVRGKLEGKEFMKKQICKLSNEANLAGLDGIRGIDSINWSTSMGHPINEPKTYYVRESKTPVIGITRPLEIDDHWWEEVAEMEKALLQGDRIYPIAKAHLKDEAKKIGSEKVRVFYGTPFAFLLLVRRYCLTLSKFYMDNPDIFETTVGMNVFGPEWNEMAMKMTKETFDRLVAGDFIGYDSLMAAQMILCGGKGLTMLASWSENFDAEDIIILQGIFTELANPMLDFFGTYIEVFGCNTSGHSLTIILNDWVQKLYNRAAYYMVYDKKPPRPYRDVVTLRTNGDDNIASVKKGEDNYNHTAIQEAFASVGIGYTMPNKTDESVPFAKLEDVDYLKRRFKWSVKHERYHAALDKDSIFKMLQIYEPSKAMSDEKLCAQNIDTALQEMYFHGAKDFFEFREKMDEVVDIHDLRGWFPDKQLKTFEECEKFDVEQYKGGSQLPVIDEPMIEVQFGRLTAVKSENPDVHWGLNKNGYTCIGYHGSIDHLVDTCLGLHGLWDVPRDRPLFRGALPRKERLYLSIRDPDATDENKWIPTYSNDTQGFDDVTNNVSVERPIDNHQTLTFRDGMSQWISAIPNIFDRTRDVAMDNDVPLDKFFERPILVKTVNWDPAGVVKFYDSFNPWSLFFGNSRIINRINNYQLMRCKLKVKFVVNGNSFYYGRMICDYAVRPDQDTVSLYTTGTTLNSLMGASQRLHIFIDPTESQGGILCLPYISDVNNMRIPNADWSVQGTVYMREMSKLKHASGSVNPVSISIYVWAEDVMLSVPTKENSSSIVAQCGCIDDSAVTPEPPKIAGFIEEEFNIEPQTGEYSNGGALSKMMSSVAGAAGKLISYPVIGPYAKATSTIAGAAGSVAQLFGYSRPAQIENQMLIRRQFIGPLTNTDRGDTCVKLTVDSKQELSVDPRIMGIGGTDELQISYIASKESWFAQVPWAISDRVNKLLFTCWVTPNIVNAVGLYYHPTPSAFAVAPFKYWRGSMIYRFNIVASAYHRGRLLFVYAPNQQIGAGESQTQYSRIVDLSNERDFTMEVGWASERSFLETGGPAQASIWATTPIGSSGNTMNGTLSVFVLNDLTSSSDTTNNDITINVFSRAADDLNVAAPLGTFKDITYLNTIAPQAGDEQETSPETNAPVKEDIEECVAKCLEIDNTFDVYFGEQITSFRQMLKRYMHHTSFAFTGLSASSTVAMNEFDFPIYRGYTSEGRESTTTTPANVCNTTLINYLAPAFVGYRGGIRAKYVARQGNVSQGGRFSVFRNSDLWTPFVIVVGALNVANQSIFKSNALAYGNLFEGGEVTDLSINPVLEVELPYYSNTRFGWARKLTSLTTNSIGKYSHNVKVTSAAADNVYLDKYVSVGEDFTFLLFQGAPPYQYTPSIPVPTT